MTSSPSDIIPLTMTAVMALTFFYAIQTTQASPLPPHPSLPGLEQELDSLLPPSQPIPNHQDDLKAEGPPPSHTQQQREEESLQEVLHEDQDLSSNNQKVPLPEKNLPLPSRLDLKHREDASPVGSLGELSGSAHASANPGVNLYNSARLSDQEENMDASNSEVKGIDQLEREQVRDFQDLNKVDGQNPENLPQSDVRNSDQVERFPEGTTSVQNTHTAHHWENSNRQEKQLPDLNIGKGENQKTELPTLHSDMVDDDSDDDDDDDEDEEEEEEENEEEEEEEANHIIDPFLPVNSQQDENEMAARELDSLDLSPNLYPTDMYDGYDSEDDDDNDDDDDEVENAPQMLSEAAKDDGPVQTPPEDSSLPVQSSNMADIQGTPLYKSPWRMDDRKWSRHDFHDVLSSEGVKGVEMKRGEGEDEEEEDEEDEEEGRFRPVRVVVLNETLYLNASVDPRLPEFQPVPLPVHFEDYDVNRDGVISLPELRYVSRAREGVKEAFRAADSDGDGWVDRAEFQVAGWGRAVRDYAPLPPSPSPSRETVRHSPLPPPS